MKKILLTILLAVAAGAGIFLIAKDNTSNGNDKLSVVASYYPLYDFARQVGGDKVHVTNITPAGTEPHDYEPPAKTLADLQKADVFLYNGGRLEPWADSFVKDYKHTIVKASNGIRLKQGSDPHFWLDPVLAQRMVAAIRDGLIKADPANKASYVERAAVYNQRLAKLDQSFREGLQRCAKNTIISSHEAFTYLADRYDFHVTAIAGLNPEEEPSAARLAELSQKVKQEDIGYVFFESLVSPRLADTIAAETGAKTLVLDPIEGLSDENQRQGKDYLSIQRENLANLRTALACD